MVSDMENLITIKQASDLIGLSTATLRLYIKSGKLKAFRLGHHKVLVDPEDIKALLTPFKEKKAPSG